MKEKNNIEIDFGKKWKKVDLSGTFLMDSVYEEVLRTLFFAFSHFTYFSPDCIATIPTVNRKQCYQINFYKISFSPIMSLSRYAKRKYFHTRGKSLYYTILNFSIRFSTRDSCNVTLNLCEWHCLNENKIQKKR